ncbi:unnamed protein product [Brassica rapa]|uniref:Rad60/SUMO-like domain-containing protein n=2 Tax=Brassica campestris TaxID=3711 RepID=A0A8D9DG33_BRACM|nr:unnamed protein product [Brassica rapa]
MMLAVNFCFVTGWSNHFVSKKGINRLRYPTTIWRFINPLFIYNLSAITHFAHRLNPFPFSLTQICLYRLGGAHINLKVKGHDGNEVFYRIKSSTQLKKLMDAYDFREHKQCRQIKMFSSTTENERN